MSTQLLLTNTLLAIADLPGAAGGLALTYTLLLVSVVVGPARLDILSKLGHADNDLRVLKKPSTSCLGRIQWFLRGFTGLCSFMQSFQLQSSKVSKDYKRKVQFILNFVKIHFYWT